jgi:PAS domain S-box-containing protein
MSTRQLIIEAYLHVLAFALLAMGLISLAGYLGLDNPTVHTVVLLPDSAVLSTLLGGLLLCAVRRAMRPLWLFAALMIGCTLYTLVHNYLAGGSEVGRSLLTGFIRMRSALVATLLVSALAICLCLGPALAKRVARALGLAIILLAAVAHFSWDLSATSMFSLGFKFSSTHIANLFTFLLGGAIILLSLQESRADVPMWRLPLLAGALGATLTCGGWYLLSLQTIDTLTRESDLLLSKVQTLAEDTLQNRLDLMKRMAERWQVLGALPSEAYWQQEARSYLRDFPNLHLVGVLDEQLKPHWLEARDEEKARRLRDFLARPEQAEWLNHALNDDVPHISRAVGRVDGAGAHALLASSLRIPGDAPRLIVATLDIQGALGELLGDELGGFIVKAYEGEMPIYSSRSHGRQRFNTPVGERLIDFHHDQRWRLVSYIDDSVALNTSRLLPALIMLFGLVLSFFLMLSQRLAGLAIERAAHLQGANGELQRSLASQLKTQALNQRIMAFTQDVLCSFDREGRFLEVSPSCVKLFGYRQDELIGRPYLELVLPEDHELTQMEAAEVMAGRPSYGFRNRYRHRDGRILHILWSADWSAEEETLFAVAHDITALVHNEAFTESQRDILSMISMDRPQSETLEAICHMVEAQEPGSFCSVLLLDAEGKQLYTGAAPSLPADYNRAIDGAAIGPNAGSCGTAAYRRQLVVVEDIEIDPLWADYRDLARPHGLRACWSFPLISHHGQVLGTFALYQKAPHAPSDEQIQHLAMAAQLAAIAIARTRDRQQLQESEQRFRSLFTFNPDPVFAFDLKGHFLSMNGAGMELTGLREEQILGRHFAELVVAEDLKRVLQHFASACRGIPQRYEMSIQDAAGRQLHLDVSNLPIMVDGELVGVFGLAKDITERERITAELNSTLARAERQAEQLRGLGAAAIATAKLHDHQTLINYLVEQVRMVIGAHQAVLSLTRGADWSQAINGVALSDKYAAWREYVAVPDGSGIYALICETNEPLMLTQEELERHPRWAGFGEHAAGHPPMRGWLAVPLIDKNGANLGLLQLSDKMDGEFDADDLTIVQQFAQMAVSFLENNRLLNEVMAAEQRLKAQLDFTFAITDCLAEGLLAIDEHGVLTFVNPAARRLLAAGQEPLGLQMKQLLPLDPQVWEIGAGVGSRGEFELKGQTLHYDARPLISLVGAHGWVVALRDVSVQRRAEQAMRERNQFFSLSLEMFCMVSLQGHFIQVNPAFASILNYRAEELVGLPYIELIDTADRDRVQQAIEQLQDGELIRDLTIRVWDGLGRPHWLQFSAALGEDRVIYCAARDITEQKAIEDQIAQHNLILSMAGQTARLGGWSIELPGREVVWSEEMFGLLGFEPGKVPTLDEGLALYPPYHRAAISAALEACVTEGQSFDLDVEIRHASGMLLDARLAGQAVRGEDGRIVRISGALQDISERKRAQREIQRLAMRLTTTLESITDAFYTLDTRWHFSYVNQEASQQLRVSVDEMLGKDIWEVFPGARESEIGSRYMQAMADHQAAHFEAYYPPMERWFEVHAYPSEEGLAVYFRDITERRRTEEELQATLLELERSNRELQEFAFVASHDLQEPLRKIQAFSDRLTARADGLDEEGRDYLQRMTSAASRMQALIIDLLNYSRVNTRGQSLQAVELERVLDEVLLDMEAGIEQAACRIERQPLPAVLGDASQLRQVIQNLLSNALKFQAPGNSPLIRIYAEPATGGGSTLCIADNGIGFDEKYLDRIFNPFQRLHGREAYSGTGIGLAIVKKIIERHGASITASSTPGQGSVFRITFPRINKDSP